MPIAAFSIAGSGGDRLVINYGCLQFDTVISPIAPPLTVPCAAHLTSYLACGGTKTTTDPSLKVIVISSRNISYG
jgi:hypothetical protein